MLDADLHGSIGQLAIDTRITAGRGSVTALIGPSGCGKTTMLRMIAGLHPISGGHVTFGGSIWEQAGESVRVQPEDRRVGFVFQQFALFPRMSALGNVRFAFKHLPRGERTGEATKLLAAVGLKEAAPKRPASLSGGERQRLAIARALASDPEVLLLDEPFASLDGRTADRMRELVGKSVAERDIACVLVTHEESDCTRLASSTVRIDSSEARILT